MNHVCGHCRPVSCFLSTFILWSMGKCFLGPWDSFAAVPQVATDRHTACSQSGFQFLWYVHVKNLLSQTWHALPALTWCAWAKQEVSRSSEKSWASRRELEVTTGSLLLLLEGRRLLRSVLPASKLLRRGIYQTVWFCCGSSLSVSRKHLETSYFAVASLSLAELQYEGKK